MKGTANHDAIILACWATEDPLLRQLETDAALIPLGDKPMLQRVLEKLVDLGCRRIAVAQERFCLPRPISVNDGDAPAAQIDQLLEHALQHRLVSQGDQRRVGFELMQQRIRWGPAGQ